MDDFEVGNRVISNVSCLSYKEGDTGTVVRLSSSNRAIDVLFDDGNLNECLIADNFSLIGDITGYKLKNGWLVTLRNGYSGVLRITQAVDHIVLDTGAVLDLNEYDGHLHYHKGSNSDIMKIFSFNGNSQLTTIWARSPDSNRDVLKLVAVANKLNKEIKEATIFINETTKSLDKTNNDLDKLLKR